MTQGKYVVPLHSETYSASLAEQLNKGLEAKFCGGKPHALTCSISSGRYPRLIDFSAWRKIGIKSHHSASPTSEPPAVRDALSIAAFLIGDSGGFLSSLPNDAFEQPSYIFMTHSLIAYDHSKLRHLSQHKVTEEEVAQSFYVAQTRGVSAHSALQAMKQANTMMDTIFSGLCIECRFKSQAAKRRAQT